MGEAAATGAMPAGHGRLYPGTAAVDEFHRRLQALYEDLRIGIDAGLPRAALVGRCDALFDEARRHFAEEEAEMAATGYPGAESHRALHDMFLAQVQEVRVFLSAMARDRGARDGGASVGRHLLLAMVGRWLRAHAQVADRRFAEYLAGRGRPEVAGRAG